MKLRGYRIELADVEHYVRRWFECHDTVAEVLEIPGSGSSPVLVAFFLSQERAATAKLHAVVPAYMVPAAFLKSSRVPRTKNGKLDRRKLGEEAALYSPDEDTSTAGAMKQEPKSEREQLLCSGWAIVLKVLPERIGADDDLFSLGGDSTRAMKLASMAREPGLSLSVSSIFDHPVLASMVKVADKSLRDSECNEY